MMADAAKYNGQYASIAAQAAMLLPRGASILDIGAGIGALSGELLMRGFPVTALEADPLAVRQIPAACEPICMDAFSFMPKRVWDASLFCFFGAPDEILQLSARFSNGVGIAVGTDGNTPAFSKGKRRYSIDPLCELLAKRGIAQSVRRFTADCTQPFRSVADAELFHTRYGGDLTGLVRTDDPVFGYAEPAVRTLKAVYFDFDGKGSSKHA